MKLLRGVAILIALAVIGLIFFSQFGIPSYSRPAFSFEGQMLPTLNTVGVLDGNIDLVNGAITIVLVVDPDTMDTEKTTQDILALYRWGAPQLEPGGAVEIWLLVAGSNSIPVVEGSATPYFTILQISLEKTQIQRLLRQPPLNLSQLIPFHQEVAETTGQAQGTMYSPEEPVLYFGIR